MAQVRHIAQQIRSIRVPVLICGESGTGKEVLARYLHDQSTWRTKPFLKMNCAAIPATLLESELFGYEKGAFTGAYGTRRGKFELAEDGTVCLDEISELSPALQAKLLQVLQDGTFYRVGGCEEIAAQAQVMCLSNRDLASEVERGAFRRDLYYRINVMKIEMPPLRARKGDIFSLFEYFLQKYSAKFSRPLLSPSKALLDKMLFHTWPGNIRELENLVKRYVVLGSEEVIKEAFREEGLAKMPNDLPGTVSAPPHAAVFGSSFNTTRQVSLKKFSRQASEKAERYLILQALKATCWNRKQAADLLNISYRALLYKIRGIQIAEQSERSVHASVPDQD